MKPADVPRSRFGHNVLFVTPFASHPPDSGQRRRVLQMASLLKRAGYRLSFVLYAFELPWYWYFDDAAYADMVEAWGEVHVFPASPKTGLPPTQGPVHRLDEWWEPEFEAFLKKLSNAKTFDIVFVTNVWLSKAFYANISAIKVLDTLDLFCERRRIAARTGIAPEFFWLSAEDELLGWHRADLVVTVTEEEKGHFGAALKAPVLCLPIVADGAATDSPRRTYLHDDRVVFGVLSSAQVYTVMGLNAMISELEQIVAADYAPVDVVVAGTIAARVKTAMPVRNLGVVETEQEFFDQVDIVLAPQFDGTGFKVKVADALIAGMPVLAAEHSAVGTFLPRTLRFHSPKAMAQAMSCIALERPPLSRLLDAARTACDALLEERDIGANELLIRLARLQTLIVDLRGLSFEDHAPVFISYICWTRVFSRWASVFILHDEKIEQQMRRTRNRYFELVSEAELPALLAARLSIVGLGPVAHGDIPGFIRDPRWDWLVDVELVAGGAADDLAGLPFLHGDASWLPGIDTLTAGWKTTVDPVVPRVAFVSDATFARALIAAWGDRGKVVDVSNKAEVCAAIKSLLVVARGSVEVMWYASDAKSIRTLVMEISTLQALPYVGSTAAAHASLEELEGYALAILSGAAALQPTGAIDVYCSCQMGRIGGDDSP